MPPIPPLPIPIHITDTKYTTIKSKSNAISSPPINEEKPFKIPNVHEEHIFYLAEIKKMLMVLFEQRLTKENGEKNFVPLTF